MTALLVAALTFTLAHHTPDTLVEYRTSAYRCLCTERNCVYMVIRKAGAKRDTLEIANFDYEPSRPMPWPAHLSRWRKVEGRWSR